MSYFMSFLQELFTLPHIHMSEQIIARFLWNKHKWSIAYDRKKFYEEQVKIFKETWSPTMAVSIVDILLFNESGELIIQKRAKHKNHNAWLMDKTVWGHVQYGDPIDYTVMVETVEELQCPSLVVKEDEDFEQRLRLLKNYTKTLAVISHVDTDVMMMEKQMHGETITIANRVYLYFGVYGGRLKNVDKEAMGILYYNLEDLKEEMKQYPDMFTYDLKYFIKHYEKDIESFIELIKDVLDEEK